ncbi:helix-turn-helix domain-containing protein [Oceanobacillus damuensis]|uniref:helix-turn-helix domain-containing protein n=1 Tax=Oceanobacillus damuensis TaxID=937928 RepID=UPI0008319673|nr:helix-turn-helix domain-containing protein [Oceanobacillus damuensis]
MSLTDYITRYIEKEFGEVGYQIWKYNGVGGKAEILERFAGREQEISPMCDPYTANYYVKKGAAHTELHFYYSGNKGLVLRIAEKLEAVDESVMEHLYYSLYSTILEEFLSAKKQEQKTIIESMHSISSSLDLDHVLKQIIRHALNVIPAADAGYLMLYDSKKQKLIPKAPVGFNDEIYQFETKVGESITGKVFEDGKSRLYNSHDELIAAMHSFNVSSKNLTNIIQSSGFVDGAICVPVSIDDKRIGVMIIHQWKMKKHLGEEDITLLEAFARQAAIAIENAQYHSETINRLQQITDLSAQLKKRNIQLQKRQEVHDTLIMLSLQNKGIHVLVDGLQKMIDMDFVFFNGLENEFYSPREDDLVNFSEFEIKTLCKERRRVFYVVTDHEESYYLYPIYNGQIFVGCLIVSLHRSISEFDQITLEQGATVLALELVNRQTTTKIYHRRVYEQFNKLLTCDEKDQVLEYGKELNLDIYGYWVVAVLEISKERTDFQYLDIYVHQLASRLRRELGDQVKLVYGFYNKINLLLSPSNREEVYQLKAHLNQIRVQEENKDGTIFRGGISSVYQGLEYIGKSYDEANKIISYLTNYNSLEVILYEDIGLNRLFLNQPTGDIEQFIQETLSPLSTENSRHKELENTLFTYMETNRSPGKTAKLLHIHINTFYQRLQTIEELLDVDLNNSQDALKIQLACHLKRSQLITG